MLVCGVVALAGLKLRACVAASSDCMFGELN